MTKDEMKDKISMALKAPVLQQGFEIICKKLAELEKENAELKEQCSILADCNTCHSTCKNENVEMKKQLIKAKEIIRKLVNEFYYLCELHNFATDYECLSEAEQFIREVRSE